MQDALNLNRLFQAPISLCGKPLSALVVPNNKRTPEQHRAICDDWRLRNANKTDSDIFGPRVRPSSSPRHAALANKFAALLYWRQLSHVRDPLATNLCRPNNDQEPTDGDNIPFPSLGVECELETRPSVKEMRKACAEITFKRQKYGFPYLVPVGGYFEYGTSVNDPRKRVRKTTPLARLNTLLFATNYHAGGNTPCLGALIARNAQPGTRGLADIGAAVQMCHARLETERSRASALICERLKPEYTALVREICAALRVVHDASLKHHVWLNQLSDFGIRMTSLAVVDHRFLNNPDGHPQDKWNSMSHYFAEAKQKGHISAADIPSELQH